MSKRSKKKKQKKTILSDHIMKGKTLLPILEAKLGEKLCYINWIDDLLPELIWIGLAFDNLGNKAADVVSEFAIITNEIVKPEKSRLFAFIYEYYGITDKQFQEISKRLAEKGKLNDLKESIEPLVFLYPECPLSKLFDSGWSKSVAQYEEAYEKRMTKVCKDHLYRRGKTAMITQATAIYIGVLTGKIKIPEGTPIDNINAIFKYPDTDESQKVASFVRAMLNMPKEHSGSEVDNSKEWCSYFWKQGYKISSCQFLEPSKDARVGILSISEIIAITHGWAKLFKEEFMKSWVKCEIDLSSPKEDEVLGGLIARQIRLATVVITSPELWAIDLGRIIARCMVDTHITLSWLIKKGNKKDFEKFIKYGLGQEKLLLEHLKAKADENPELTDLKRRIESIEDWIDSQMWVHLVPVNLGNWHEKNIYDMATESDCKEIYNLAYSPHSSVLHGMWNAIERLNLQICLNPLHRLHKVPSLDEPPLNLEILFTVLNIMEESYKTWRKYYNLTTGDKTTCEEFKEELLKLFKTGKK